MKLRLSIAFAENVRTRPVLDGRAQAEGIELAPSVVGPSELFWRQLRFADFDVAEMSFSSLIIAMSKGDDRFVGLPIFTTRRFFHSHILVRKGSGIEKPEDLKGKRVGVTEYQQTGALWTRGALEHEWGVRSQDMEFFMERTPELSHGGATGFTPPPGVRVHQIPSSKSVASMMLSGELDAAIHYRGHGSIVNRSNVNLLAHPDVRTLFPDVRQTISLSAASTKKNTPQRKVSLRQPSSVRRSTLSRAIGSRGLPNASATSSVAPKIEFTMVGFSLMNNSS